MQEKRDLNVLIGLLQQHGVTVAKYGRLVKEPNPATIYSRAAERILAQTAEIESIREALRELLAATAWAAAYRFDGDITVGDMQKRARAALHNTPASSGGSTPEFDHFDAIVRRRFGPAFEKPCDDPNMIECAMWECQERNRCRRLALNVGKP